MSGVTSVITTRGDCKEGRYSDVKRSEKALVYRVSGES